MGKSAYGEFKYFSGRSGFAGPMGVSGVSGQAGTPTSLGVSGYSGVSGVSGASGVSGVSGTLGMEGYSGNSGLSGTVGYSGTSGTLGANGNNGTSGYSGGSGTSGLDGNSLLAYSGASGALGQSGYSGALGQSGYSGALGQSGQSGVSGQSGTSGSNGDVGVSGVSGLSGVSGASIQGISGYSGASGVSGAAGTTGFLGTSGANTSGYSGTSGRSGYSGSSTVAAGSVGQGNLKTSMSAVTTVAAANLTLPGGAYGFWPMVKASATSTTSIYFAQGLQTITAITNIYCSGNGSATISAQQRYVTASGRDYWIFLLIDKDTNKIISAYAAPDHPAYGNGGDFNVVQHPFPDYDETKHVVVIVEKITVENIRLQSITNHKDILDIVNEDKNIGVDATYVPLHSGKIMDNDGIQIFELVETMPSYIKCKTLVDKA